MVHVHIAYVLHKSQWKINSFLQKFTTKMSVQAWIDAQPDSKAVPSRTERSVVYELLQSPENIILDIRSDRSPAYIGQSFHVPAVDVDGPGKVKEAVLDPLLAKFPDTKQIIVHCNSSRQRASKIAGWLQDYFNENPSDLKVTILHEGIAGWLTAGEPYESLLVKVE